NSQVSGFTDPRGRVDGDQPQSEVVDAVRRPTGRKKVVAAAAALLGVVLAGVLTFTLIRSPAPVAAVEGEVTVESDPPGASLVVDGLMSTVKTPGTLRMLAFDQDLRVRIEKEGREPREVTVRLTRQAPSKTVSVLLPEEAAKPGTITLVTEPPGASVVLDGKLQEGATPLTLPEVASGVEHLIRVSLAGHQEEAATVKVQPGATEAVKLSLKVLALPEPQSEPELASDLRAKKSKKDTLTGEVEISSTPSADIFLGTKKLGRTPATVKLPVGKVTLTFVNAEIDLRQTSVVNVEAKGKTRSAIQFRKGKIAADAKPWADVYIGERKLGTTPLAPREVYEGSYTLRLVNSELGAIKAVKVVVQPGKTTVVREQLQ
ncbi:PEGA domain-containing protein, partial [Hyalangium sp.]|uniref:PEGA domain-containing protein n=1 Tax=Hyalangium sp. TaxID=2028555 RepID=UPI002D72EBF4